MKIQSLISLAMVASLMTACSDEMEQTSNYTEVVLTATVEGNNPDSRVGFDEKGKFYWSVDDQIGVTCSKSDDNSFLYLNLASGVGKETGSFKGGIAGDIADYDYAVYPYYSGIDEKHHSLDKNLTLKYYFPISYEYDKVDTDFFTSEQGTGNSFNPAMWGQIVEGKVHLKHLGGVFCIKIEKMPVTEGYLYLIVDEEIAGIFTAYLNNDEPTLNAGDETHPMNTPKVSIKFKDANVGLPGVFYVPVPIGTYNSVQINVDDVHGNTKINVETGTHTIKRAHAKPLIIDANAVEAAKLQDFLKTGNNSTYTLTTDVTGDFVVSTTNPVTINLNGHTITNKSGDTFTVNKNSSLTINGSGTVDNISHKKACIYNNGSVILDGGTYTRSKETNTNSYYNILNHGSMQIQPTVTVKQTGLSYTMIANGYTKYDSGDSRSGYVKSINYEVPMLTINGGTFNGGMVTIKNDENGTLNITDGTFTNGSQTIIQNYHEATITGGEFDGSKSPFYVIDNYAYNADYAQGIMTISGGTFTGKVRYFVTDGVTNSKMSITGGTFSDPNVLQYLGKGANVTVELVKDIELTNGLGIVMDKDATAAATVKLNGKTIKNSIETPGEETPTSRVFYVKKGTLTIEGEGNVQSIASESSKKNGFRMVVTADGDGIVNINGGNYYNKQNVDGQLDLIFAKGNGKIYISGGTFESGTYSEPGKYWVLNKPNGTTGSCTISVTGGKFINFNPGNNGSGVSYLANGYSAYLNGASTTTTEAYNPADGRSTYEVKTTTN